MESVLHRFKIISQSQILQVLPHGQGHIHQSFKVNTDKGQFFLQQINQNVFPEPDHLMRQMLRVTHHLEHFYLDRALPYIVPAIHLSDEELPFVLQDGSYWRLFDFISESYAVDKIDDREQVADAAQAFSSFIEGLSSLDLEGAYYPIPKFHDLHARQQQLMDAIDHNNLLADTVDKDINLCQQLIEQLEPLIIKIENGLIPTRWTHNDTKFNNLLLDREGKPVSVVDLDTVMPGCILYDVGDVLRTTCSSLSEDDPAVHNMHLDTLKRDWFLEDFIRSAESWITFEEIQTIDQSGALMATLMATRFLTDHLRGDFYYKTKKKGKTLDRAKTKVQWTRLFLKVN
jgi:aminoglycoside phosphotransferase (APT) family kinase protein